MSEARQHRFEIDIDEIERQLRRSVESSPPPKADPLAELARIVGQDDPFRGILGGSQGVQSQAAVSTREPGLSQEDRSVLVDRDPEPDLYDPVVSAYGSAEAAYAQDEFQPLPPRRSRKRLAAVLASLGVGVIGIGGVLAYRNSGTSLSSTGAPPIISADRTPLKVPPDNPGGMEVPNQNRQIYDRGATDGQSRIVDSREQPVDVREAVRGLPSGGAGAAPDGASTAGRPNGAPGAQPRPNAVANALGEPRRVRTVAVRLDGTVYAPTNAAPAPEAQPSLLPGRSFPPPVPVATVSVPAGQSPGAAPSPAAPPAVVDAANGTPSGPTVTVLPPQRPRTDARVAAATPEVAGQPRPTTTGSARPAPTSTASTTGGFAVQIAVRPSETEARSAASQLQGRYASELQGRTASIAKGEVNGKDVYRVRFGGLSRDDANALCNRLKSSGGQCFVAGN